jgi:hypothetical protein
MPSNFTHHILSDQGTTLAAMVTRFAHAFYKGGADNIDAPLASISVPPHFYTEREEAKDRLDRALAFDDATWAEKAATNGAEYIRYYTDAKAYKAAVRARYEAMVARVEDWTPPSQNHQALKDFILAHLAECMDVDCPLGEAEQYDEMIEKAKFEITGPELKAQYLEAARKDFDRRDEQLRLRVAEVTMANGWIEQLQENLEAIGSEPELPPLPKLVPNVGAMAEVDK